MNNQQVFAHDDDDVGAVYRRPPQPQFDKVKSHITDLFQKGLTKSSQSEFVGPIVTCRKKNGKISVCVDSRRLNTKTRKDAFPLPRVDEIVVFDHLAGAKNFSTVDLESAYNQVEIDEADQHKTAFTTPMGLYEYRPLHFTCNLPEIDAHSDQGRDE